MRLVSAAIAHRVVMRNRLLHGVHAFFTNYVWMVLAIWVFWIVLDVILGVVVFPENQGGIWYIGLGGTLGCLLGLFAVAFLKAIFHKRVIRALDGQKYHSLAFMERTKRMIELAPSWYRPLQWVQNAWVWGELIVLLTNRKRRALHDFIAGTVVVYASSKATPPVVAAPVVSA